MPQGDLTPTKTPPKGQKIEFNQFKPGCGAAPGQINRAKTAPRRFVPPSGKGSPEWYTPAYIIEAAREVMGGIDCDPASCAIAQETVKATVYYTKEDDGLSKPWHGRVWLNPPFDFETCDQFVSRVCLEIDSGQISEATIVIPSWASRNYGQLALTQSQAFCSFEKRIKYYTPSKQAGNPFYETMVFYFGPNKFRFAQVFGAFGAIATPYRTLKEHLTVQEAKLNQQ